MKKVSFGLALALVFGFFLSPAFSETNQPQAPALGAADQAFLASLSKTPTPVSASKRPRGLGQEKALCSATAHCWDGSTVSCESNTSTASCSSADSNCRTERGHATCNGVANLCPPCPCGPDFCTAQDQTNCSISCKGCPYTLTCSPTSCLERCRCLVTGPCA